jgi:hypothetical protein
MSIESPLLFVHIGLLDVRAIGSKPLASIGNTLLVGQTSSRVLHRNACRLAWSLGSRFESQLGDA